ncbi:MAG: hypothetical protein NZ879_04415 [Archaeoglobaceae archaeon]|nr:hypothetical protein [Archaeoglobaceae archaeon]MDW8118207.1 hypothetical protein [Archaeoglobaceae archaeon]
MIVSQFEIPDWIEEIFQSYLTAEFTYMDGKNPRTIAVLPYYDSNRKSIVITTSPAFYRKVECVKKNPRVSILFSNSKFSGIEGNAVVLVQGFAKVDEDIEKNMNYLLFLMMNQKDNWKKTVVAKMVEELMSPLAKKLMDWYVYRIVIEIKPQRILFWRDGNLDNPPEIIEVKF